MSVDVNYVIQYLHDRTGCSWDEAKTLAAQYLDSKEYLEYLQEIV